MMAGNRSMWLLVAACAVHVAEEYLLDWRSWVESTSGLQLSWTRFWIVNAGFLLLACVSARMAPRHPVIGLALPSLALINGLFFHIGPSLVLRRVSPGLFSSALLYVPISILIFRQAYRRGVLTLATAARAVALGAGVMALPFVLLAWG